MESANEKMIRLPPFTKPDPETQKLIEEGKLKFAFSSTGGINPNGKGLRPGVYYERIQ